MTFMMMMKPPVELNAEEASGCRLQAASRRWSSTRRRLLEPS
jgi:hypothetical protein